MNEENNTKFEVESIEHPILTTNMPPSPDLLDTVGIFPIALILLTIIGGIFGFKFLKNTKQLKLDQKIKSSNHKENVKTTEDNAIALDNITTDIIKNIVNSDKIASAKTNKIQENINNATNNIKNINSKDQSISDTKNRLKNALDKLGDK